MEEVDIYLILKFDTLKQFHLVKNASVHLNCTLQLHVACLITILSNLKDTSRVSLYKCQMSNWCGDFNVPMECFPHIARIDNRLGYSQSQLNWGERE